MNVPSRLYSSTRRKRPHCARRIFLNPRTGPGTRCDFGQNGQTNRVPCAFGMRSTTTDQPGLHNLYSTGSGGGATTRAGRTGLVVFVVALAVRLADARFTGRLVRRLAARPVRDVLVARMVSALAWPPSIHGLALLTFTSCAARSAYRYACSCGSSCPAWGKPKASAGDCP